MLGGILKSRKNCLLFSEKEVLKLKEELLCLQNIESSKSVIDKPCTVDLDFPTT